MDKNKLIEFFKPYIEKRNFVGLFSKINRNPELKIEIEYSVFNIIDKCEVENLSEAIYFIINNITVKPKCPVCGGKLKYKNINIGHFKTCSATCNQNYEVTKKTLEENNLRKYGVVHHTKTKEYRDYIRKRCENNEFGFSSAKYKQYLENNNVSNVSQIPEINEKIRKTINERTDEDNEEIQRKIKHTLQKRYNVDNAYELAKRFLYHEYVLPSNKIIKLQGYEHVALDLLLKQYSEEDIMFRRKEVPVIIYEFNGANHKFYPDFYIPKDNLIIEVKSDWTFKTKKEQNILKLEAAKLHYNAFIWICSKNELKDIIK